MKKWEYLTAREDVLSKIELLNDLGAQGYELCVFAPNTGGWGTVIFKREKIIAKTQKVSTKRVNRKRKK